MTLRAMLARERNRGRSVALIATAAMALAAALMTIAIGAWLLGNGAWVALPGAVPLLWWAIVLGIAGAVARWRLRSARRDTAVAGVATAIEQERGLRRGEVRGALEVSESGELGAAAARSIADRLAGAAGSASLAPKWRERLTRQATRGAIMLLVAAALLLAAGVARPDGALVLAAPVDALRGTLLPAMTLDAPAAVGRGDRFAVVAAAPRRSSATLRHRTTGSGWRESGVELRDGAATVGIGPVDADVELELIDARGRAVQARVRVVDRPFVGDVVARATFPAYLQRPAEAVPTAEPITLPRGTVLELSGRASTPLDAVRLNRGRDTIRMSPHGRAFTGRLSLAPEMTGRWEWSATAAQPIADVPGPLDLSVIPDSAPRVDVPSPNADTVTALGSRMVLTALAADDHGLSRVELRLRRAPLGKPGATEMVRRLDAVRGAQWAGEIAIDFASLSLEPGDAVHARVDAVDDSPWEQRGSSRTVVIRLPSAEERRELARSAADSVVAATTSTARRQQELARRTEETARARGDRSRQATDGTRSASRSEPLGYERQEQAKALAQQQKELGEQIRQLEKQTAELQQRLRDAGALDSALSRQLDDVRRLLADAITPQMSEQLRELERALQDLSADRARDALRDLAREQQRLREQLEQSAEMLKRAALEGAMETLADDAKDLAKRQRAAADSAGRRNANQGQRKLSDQAETLEKRMEELARKLLKEQATEGAAKAEQAAQQAEASADAMRRAEQSGGEQSAEAARQAADAMEEASDELREAREQQIDQWREQLTDALDRSIQEMLQLASEERELEARARQGEGRNTLQGPQGSLQQGTQKAAERVEQASRQSAHVGAGAKRAVEEARRRVADATNTLAETQGEGQRVADEMRDAADALTRAAGSLVRDRQRAAAGRTASGFSEMMEALQALAQQQGALSAQGMSLLPVPGGQSPAQAEMQGAAGALARQQRALADKLDEVSDAAGDARAAELAAEARQIARALESGAVDQTTVARQQRLFRRLLDAGRTLERDEREDTGKREARAAGDVEVHQPGDAVGRERRAVEVPKWEDLRGLSPEERRAVLEYFRRLNSGKP